jgi:hypothetical protein
MYRKWQISRRALLRGSGYAVALPLLEAMLPFSKANAATVGTRFLSVYFGNGVLPDQWYPTGTGANWTLSPGLQNLANIKQHLTVIQGLTNDAVTTGYAVDGGIGHWSACISFLTGQIYDYSLRTQRHALARAGGSLDQVYGATTPTMVKAIHMGPPSLTFNNSDTRGFGTFLTQQSYRASNRTSDPNTAVDQIVPRMNTSRQVFKALFGGQATVASTASLQATPSQQGELDKNILSFVNSDIQSLNRKLGAADKMKLDEYLTQVEELQKRIVSTEPPGPGPTPTPGPGATPTPTPRPGATPTPRPTAAPTPSPQICQITGAQATKWNADSAAEPGQAYVDRTQNMIDLMVLAFKCDVTRSISFMLEHEHEYASLADRNNPPVSGINYTNYAHHDASHYTEENGAEGTRRAVMLEFHKWQSYFFAQIVSRLASETEAGVPILDNSLVLFGTGLGDSNSHSANNMPVILAGKAGGTLKPGQLIKLNNAPYSNFLLTLAQQKLGMNINQFGQSSGTLTGF